jgi:hypothetical protein
VAKSSGGSGNGEFEHHIVAVRLRLNGSGNFQIALTDYDDVQTQNLVPIVMQDPTRFEPMRLSNFQSQRTRLVGKVTEINEWFEVGRIIIWAKPVAIEYPG